MLQESSSGIWDPRGVLVEPSGAFKVYLLFLLTVCVVTIVKIVRVWRAAPPFMLAREKGNPAYLTLLKSTAESLRLWRGFTYQGWGIFASISLYQLCNKLLDERRVGDLLVVYLILDFSATLMMALLVALFAYLLQWNLHKRVETLDNFRLSG